MIEDIKSMSGATTESSQEAHKVSVSSGNLAKMADSLKADMGKFKV
jgi:methyl-accepting chemotaxis protein